MLFVRGFGRRDSRGRLGFVSISGHVWERYVVEND